MIGAYTDYTGELSLLGKYYSYQVAEIKVTARESREQRAPVLILK